jgi:hypothetical protein
MTEHSPFDHADGAAALSICESLILALQDRNVLSEKDTRDILTDVVTAHEDASAVSESPEKHQAVVSILRRILAGTNGVRALSEIKREANRG